MTNAKARSYLLFDDKGNWLAQIVLTEDGMFSSVTDYGNLSHAWRSTGADDFRKFICSLSIDYFAGKMYQGMSYILHGKKCEQACNRFSEKILPPLQKILKKELEEGTPF